MRSLEDNSMKEKVGSLNEIFCQQKFFSQVRLNLKLVLVL